MVLIKWNLTVKQFIFFAQLIKELFCVPYIPNEFHILHFCWCIYNYAKQKWLISLKEVTEGYYVEA